MEFLYYCMEVLMRCIAFFTVSTAKMERLEEAGLDLCMKLPGIALYGVWKLIFYCFLPLRNHGHAPGPEHGWGDELEARAFWNCGGGFLWGSYLLYMEKRGSPL